jgi:hypothetical protein
MATERTQLFTEILSNARDPVGSQSNAREWLREQALSVRTVQNPKTLVTQQSDRLVTRLVPQSIGRMYLFMYDPKTKDTLPYYDRFPLVFPFQQAPGGFYGINMHYLPHILRARLMDALYATANNRNNDDTTRLRLTYNILNASARFRFYKPCIKHYLNTHVKSRYLWIPTEQWDTALFLPLERFVGASKQKVWRDSRAQIGV